MSNHTDFYSYAEFYDIAFDFKDVSKECDFMNSCFKDKYGKNIESFLEIAAGPALHCIEFGRRGVDAAALDLSSQMVQYGLQKAKMQNVKIDYFCANMVDFNIDHKFDLAATLMDSTSYLLDNDDVISHFNAVADHLNPGGLYILEMGHPRDIFNMGKSTQTNWEMQREGKKVSIQWGTEKDEFDPVTQISNTTVKMLMEDDNDNKKEIIETAPQRCFTANEFSALVKASGRFKIADIYGAMDKVIPFCNEDKSWRMVPILMKI